MKNTIDKLWVLSMNIVTNDGILMNKDNYPILLYTHDPEQVLKDIYNRDNYIGKSVFDFVVSNMFFKTLQVRYDQIIDYYIGSTLNYIYYDTESGESIMGNLDIEDIIPLEANSNNIHIKQLYYYYIYKALECVFIKVNRRPLYTSGYKAENIEHDIKDIINYLLGKPNNLSIQDILEEIKIYYKDILCMNQNNINELMKAFIF